MELVLDRRIEEIENLELYLNMGANIGEYLP